MVGSGQVLVRTASWVLDGARGSAPVTSDGKHILVLAGPYLVAWFDHTGKRHTESTRTTDKETAKRIAAKRDADAALRREGVIDPRVEEIGQQARRLLEDHLKDFEAKLRAENRTEGHVKRTLGFIREIAAACRFTVVGEIAADGVNAFAVELGKKRSARTIQARLTAIKAFTRWLMVHGKLPSDPLASVKKPDPKADRRRERRMLLPQEWDWFQAVTISEDVERDEMPAVERVLLYATAIQTGLRSGELRSLTRGRLYLDAELPYITCKAGSTKNKKDARQYIQKALATELRDQVNRKAPGASVFAMPPRYDVAAMLRADLDAARRAWLKAAEGDSEERLHREQSDFLVVVNNDKEALDFHSLRHTCGAWLAMAGAHPKAIQSVMRHSCITLTMDTYGHLFPGQEADTIARLPAMMGIPFDEALRATGTDDEPTSPGEGAQRQAQRARCGSVTLGATESDKNAGDLRGDESPKPLRPGVLGESVHRRATRSRTSRGGTRTRTGITPHGILNPVRLPFPPLGLQERLRYVSVGCSWEAINDRSVGCRRWRRRSG